MPNTYTRAEKTNGDVLYEAFMEKGINVVYPKKLLEVNKYYSLYYMYDMHWNQLEARKADFEYIVEGIADIDWEQFASDEEAERLSYFYNPNARVKKTLLLVGDSFSVAMVPL